MPDKFTPIDEADRQFFKTMHDALGKAYKEYLDGLQNAGLTANQVATAMASCHVIIAAAMTTISLGVITGTSGEEARNLAIKRMEEVSRDLAEYSKNNDVDLFGAFGVILGFLEPPAKAADAAQGINMPDPGMEN